MILVLIFLQESIIFVQCGDKNSIFFLREIYHNNVIFKCSPEITELEAKKTFDAGLNFLINNPQPKLSTCRYLGVNKNLLYNFDKRSPLSHPNLFLNKFNGYSINMQFTHAKLHDFNLFNDKDLNGEFLKQFISSKIHIYANYPQVFLNFDFLSLNQQLKIYENYQNFLPESDKSLKTQIFIEQQYHRLINEFKTGFGLK